MFSRFLQWLKSWWPKKKEEPPRVVLDSGGKDMPWCEACQTYGPRHAHAIGEPVADANDVWAQWNRDHR